jgi:putative oxidoreductase
MKRAGTIVLWIVSGLLAVVMVGPGLQKFTSPMWERMFRVWGYPDGFYLVIGAVEVVGGIGLLIPRIASYCAASLSVVMIGAAITQIAKGGRNGIGEIVFATLLTIVAYARLRSRERRRATAGRPDTTDRLKSEPAATGAPEPV